MRTHVKTIAKQFGCVKISSYIYDVLIIKYKIKVMTIQTISLNSKNYSTVNANTIDTDLYNTNDFIRVNSKTYYANKHTRKGVSKDVQKLVS